MTWGETATRTVRETNQRDEKVAVSPSRPLICCAFRYFHHALFILSELCLYRERAVPNLPLLEGLSGNRYWLAIYFRQTCERIQDKSRPLQIHNRNYKALTLR